MKAAQTKGFGFTAKLVVADVKRPKIKDNEVLVKVKASSVNPKDWKLNFPLYSVTPKFINVSRTQVFGDDLAGVIEEIGEKVVGYELGDEVYGMNMHLRTGACAEYAVIPGHCVASKPSNMSFAEAAAAPLASLTALQLLRAAKVTAGSKVLVVGASGGVGTYTVQLAKAQGAEVTGVCSARNVELVKSLGADAVIDYTQGDYRKNKDDFDVIVDCTAYESVYSCQSLLKPDGYYVTPGGHFGSTFYYAKARYVDKNSKVKTVVVRSNVKDLNEIRDYIESGKVKSVIDSEYDLSDIAQSYARSKTSRAAGKIVINIQ